MKGVPVSTTNAHTEIKVLKIVSYKGHIFCIFRKIDQHATNISKLHFFSLKPRAEPSTSSLAQAEKCHVKITENKENEVSYCYQ